jgi:hypothetical protein
MITIKKLKNYYNWGGRFLNDSYHQETKKLNEFEMAKRPFRYDVINFLLSTLGRENTYLEIGVRNPADNFNRIHAAKKYSVDPGLEFKENPVDFALFIPNQSKPIALDVDSEILLFDTLAISLTPLLNS